MQNIMLSFCIGDNVIQIKSVGKTIDTKSSQRYFIEKLYFLHILYIHIFKPLNMNLMNMAFKKKCLNMKFV